MKYAEDVTELVGRTPLVKINRLYGAGGATVLAKLEFYNPAGSVKDRVGLAIVDAAVASGELPPGGTIVEATSGNTGIGLAWVGALRGYGVVLTMPDTMSAERRVLLRALGAQVVLTPGADGMAGAVRRAEEIVAATPGAVLARQFENPANPAAHRRTTAEEIWADTDGRVDAVVAGAGTGGTVSGIGQVLKARRPGVRIVAVEPAESPLLSTGVAGPHGIQGIGTNFVPGVFDRSVVDQIVPVETATAMAWARRAAREEALFIGISGGAALAGAAPVVQELGEGAVVVVILPDAGDRYLSTDLFAEEVRA